MTKREQQNLRIIGGQWRSRKLWFPEIENLRPTSSRIRETLFNWLSPYIEGSCCLDLFSGSGALGFEALSRGAKEVVFVEPNPHACKAIQETATLLNTQAALIHCNSAENFLANVDVRPFEIIFLDPPYELYNAKTLFALIQKHCDFQKPTLVFYENYLPLEQNDLPANWKYLKRKKAGKVNFYLLEANHS